MEFFYCRGLPSADAKRGNMEGGEACPVCLEDLERAIWCTLPCAHRVCFSCLFRMADHGKHACPLCRHDLRDCIPARRVRMPPAISRGAAVEDDVAAAISEEAFEDMVRRVQVASVVDHALRTQAIAPRNAVPAPGEDSAV